MSTPKVAIVVSTYPPYAGGMGNVAVEQAQSLAARGYDVTVYTPAGGAGKAVESAGGVKVVRCLSVLRYGNAAFAPTLRQQTKDSDIVFLHYPFIGGAEGYAKNGVLPHQQLVVYYHMDTVGHGWKKFLFARYHRRYLAPLLAHAKLILVSTRDYAEQSLLAPHLKTIDKRLRELPLAVDTERFFPAERPKLLTKEYGFESDTPVALFVGGLDSAHYFKGVPMLLTAWRSVLCALPNAKLLLIGEGDKRKSFERLAKKLGIEDAVGFVGGVSNDELPNYYRLANVVVLPSIDASEAFGLVLLEAMASGRATVASDLAGVRRVVRDGETGQLVEAEDSKALGETLLHLLTRPAVAERYGERGRVVVESEYSKKVIGDKLAELLTLVL
ncbi:hypothetical protein COV04_02850 [Candidatus Uhrbacteria bacterium CG10_big_fil_rev_8_21_14_0_10_48_11]|uniref:Glycosyltransferase family 1 protein n=1 Tax=Candidatus Uhrbacteria bacterium CG10_big_fil_rev_8_21_14_0_10_48_11 TaxID=1975037 RepID=A0A2M8LEI2_9BACT|nr:MAG: hypothetical protein COV04_02850 [Candidatus Uhrbacteria bacterium CG10_big_fil_rev_8_21_14_0_10_48_11]